MSIKYYKNVSSKTFTRKDFWIEGQWIICHYSLNCGIFWSVVHKLVCWGDLHICWILIWTIFFFMNRETLYWMNVTDEKATTHIFRAYDTASVMIGPLFRSKQIFRTLPDYYFLGLRFHHAARCMVFVKMRYF